MSNDQNDPVDHEEVPVEPQEVVVQEDREDKQQQAAAGCTGRRNC